jgi:hypothetical protein
MWTVDWQQSQGEPGLSGANSCRSPRRTVLLCSPSRPQSLARCLAPKFRIAGAARPATDGMVPTRTLKFARSETIIERSILSVQIWSGGVRAIPTRGALNPLHQTNIGDRSDAGSRAVAGMRAARRGGARIHGLSRPCISLAQRPYEFSWNRPPTECGGGR